MIKVGVEYTSRKKGDEIIEFKDEIDMINYGLNINTEIIIGKGTGWAGSNTVDYVMEIYDDYREWFV